MWSSKLLQGRVCVWNDINPEQLGNILLDDLVVTDLTGRPCCLFLFETILLCCEEETNDAKTDMCYPIMPWELGPALKRDTPLRMLHAIPTANLTAVRCTDSGM